MNYFKFINRYKHIKRHCFRIEKISYLFGQLLKLTKEELNDLTFSARMHDIGKIGINRNILNKPKALNEVEYEIVKCHSLMGSKIIATSIHYKHISNIILYHHERIDGRGYPEGIKGNNIPYLSRIISIIDSFDAMINDRPYRKGMHVAEALKELRKGQDTQFDSKLVNLFISMLNNKVYLLNNN